MPMPEREGRYRSVLRSIDALTPWDRIGAVVALMLIVLFTPFLFFGGWTPRAALLLALAPVGILALIRLASVRDKSAAILIAALAWTVFASALSGAPRSALLGFAGRDLSAWTVIASSGLWAIGRRMTRSGVSFLGGTVIWAATAAALVALLQVVVGVESGPLALAAGRPSSFLTNPVYLGALCASAMALAVSRWASDASLGSTVAVVMLGAGTSVSGSRVALLAAAVTLAGLVGRAPTRRRLTGAGVGLAGLATGVLVDRVFGAGRNAADRLAEGSGGGRLEVWRYGIESWLERPILGFGFGRFRSAVQGRFSVEFVRDHAADERSQAWFDAHNAVVGLMVAVGIVGTVLFVAWLASALVASSGPLLWALVPLALHWMLQPLSLYTLPLAMLLLGAAARRSEHIAPRSARRWPIALAGAVGAVLGLGLLVADLSLDAAARGLDSDRAASVATWFWNDPIVDDVVAQLMVLDPRTSDTRAELEWRRRVANDEPDRPFWWSTLARRQISSDLLDDAEVSISTAFELQPNNVHTWKAEAVIAVRRGDEQRLERALQQLCALGQPECELTASELLSEPSGPSGDP